MTTEMITVKLEDTFLKQIDQIVEKQGYQSRTEFIRNALREKVEETETKKMILHLHSLKGAGKKEKQSTDEEIEQMKEKGYQNLSKMRYEERKKMLGAVFK